MKAIGIFLKLFREQVRDWWVAVLTFSFGPLMVFIYFLITGGGSTVYLVGYVNQDQGSVGTAYVANLAAQSYPDGRPMLNLVPYASATEANPALQARTIDCLIVIPGDFSAAILQAALPAATLTVLRDFGNFRSSLPVLLAAAGLETVQSKANGTSRYPVNFVDQALGNSGARTEFESYIPGLLVFAVILLIFQASMVAARETEQLTLRRLSMSRMRSLDFMLGITAFELLVGMLSVGCTLLVAMLCGFTLAGPPVLIMVVLILSCLSIIGLSLLLSCFVRTALQAFILANIPLGVLMFFSGAMFPMPKVVVAQIGGTAIGLFDFLPTVHAVTALNKVGSLAGGLGDIAYELGMLTGLSMLFFLAGVLLFKRLRLREV